MHHRLAGVKSKVVVTVKMKVIEEGTVRETSFVDSIFSSHQSTLPSALVYLAQTSKLDSLVHIADLIHAHLLQARHHVHNLRRRYPRGSNRIWRPSVFHDRSSVFGSRVVPLHRAQRSPARQDHKPQLVLLELPTVQLGSHRSWHRDPLTQLPHMGSVLIYRRC